MEILCNLFSDIQKYSSNNLILDFSKERISSLTKKKDKFNVKKKKVIEFKQNL